MNASVRVDVAQMKQLSTALKSAKSARVRVGILGNKAERFDIDKENQDKLNNPTLGAVPEFGSKKRNIPARSFLRMPLMLHLPKKIDEIGRAVWRLLVLQKGVLPALKQLGVTAENVVQEAFETGGWGAWPGYSRRYGRWKEMMTRAKTKSVNRIGPVRIALLILSGQMRRAVTSRVVEGKAS